MMLKIQRPDSKSHTRTPWVIFGDVLDVYYHSVSGEEFKKIIKASNEDEFPFDYNAINGEPRQVVIVEATRKKGTQLHVAFNTCGYLLNDEGKTIETLRQ